MIINRNVVGVSVINLVGDSGEHAEAFAVAYGELSREAFGGRGENREVVFVFFVEFVHAASHVRNDFQTEFLRFLAFTMMFSHKGHKTFGKTDESYAQRALIDYALYGLGAGEFFASVP